MKLLLPVLLAAALTGSSSAVVVAFWDFNDQFDVGDNAIQIVHSATSGISGTSSGIIYQQQADIDGNGKIGTGFPESVPPTPPAEDKAMGWNDVKTKNDGNAEFFVTFSTTNFDNIIVSFDISGNAVVGSGISRFDLKYALTDLQDIPNPGQVSGTIKDFNGGNSFLLINNRVISTPTDGSFVRLTYNLSSLSTGAVNNQGFVAIRFDDWKENDDMAIDNLLITGTAIPEPSALLLASFAGISLLRRRR